MGRKIKGNEYPEVVPLTCISKLDALHTLETVCNVLTLILFSLFTNRIWTRYIINGFLSDTSVRVMYKSEVA